MTEREQERLSELTEGAPLSKALELVAAKDKQLVVVERCGHMMPLDCPVRALDKAMPFIARVSRD